VQSLSVLHADRPYSHIRSEAVRKLVDPFHRPRRARWPHLPRNFLANSCLVGEISMATMLAGEGWVTRRGMGRESVRADYRTVSPGCITLSTPTSMPVESMLSVGK